MTQNVEINQQNGLDITVIIDRSGSMDEIRDDAIGAFNAFLRDRKESDSDAIMTVVLFDDTYEILMNGVPIMDVKPLDNTTYVPRGSTALLDAVGKTVRAIESRDHEDDAILVAILTDGQENASIEWRGDQIKALIGDLESKGWDFYYLSAALSAFNDGRSLGIDSKKNLMFKKKQMQEAYDQIDQALFEKKQILMQKKLADEPEDKMYQ